MIIPVPGRT